LQNKELHENPAGLCIGSPDFLFCTGKWKRKVDLRVLDYTKRAIACYEKCRFVVKEGDEREGAWIAGRYERDVMMSVLDKEYKALNQ
jgi:hypothetical protein